jgi:HEAT repeat protein
VRREAVLALERCHDPSAGPKVRRLLADPVRRVRIAAAVVQGLRREADAAPALLSYLAFAGSWEKPALMVALGRVGTPACGEALAQAAEDPVRWVRVCALHGLAEMHAPRARSVARSKLADASWSVRGAAALALGRVGAAEDAEVLAPLLEDRNAWVRRGAIYALGQLDAVTQREPIRAALDDPDPEVRLAAIWAVGSLRDVASTARLVRLLGSSRPAEGGARPILMEGDGAVRLVSDADGRLFDALVQAVGALAAGAGGSAARRALARARQGLSDAELDRPARLPTPLGAGEGSVTLRHLFASAGQAP